MAGSQISTSVTIIDSLFGFSAISWNNLDFVHADNCQEPTIAAGSKVEIAGGFFTFDSEESVTGFSAIATESNCYVELTASGTAGSQIVSASWVSDYPVWSTTKQGWYTSAGSASRVVLSARKTSQSSCDRKVDLQQYPGHREQLPRRRFTLPPTNDNVTGQLVPNKAYTDNEFFKTTAIMEKNKVILYNDTVTDDLFALEYQGGYEWVQYATGTAIETGTGNGVGLTASVFCTIMNAASNVHFYEVSGSTISNIGTTFASSISDAYDFCVALQPSRIMIGRASNNIQAYDWTGSTLTTVGSAYSVSGDSPDSAVRVGKNRVAFTDGTAELVFVLEFDGSTWTELARLTVPTSIQGGMTGAVEIDCDTFGVGGFEAASDDSVMQVFMLQGGSIVALDTSNMMGIGGGSQLRNGQKFNHTDVTQVVDNQELVTGRIIAID